MRLLRPGLDRVSNQIAKLSAERPAFLNRLSLDHRSQIMGQPKMYRVVAAAVGTHRQILAQIIHGANLRSPARSRNAQSHASGV